MEENVFITLRPLLIFGTIFGFHIVGSKQSSCKKIITTIYCTLLTVLSVAIFFGLLVIRLHNMEWNFLSVMALLMDVSIMTVVTMYRAKYVSGEEVVRSILNNIRHADLCLRRIGVKVPHKKNKTLCMLLLAAVVCVNTLSSLLAVKLVGSSRWLELVNAERSTCNLLLATVLLFSGMFLFTKTMCLLYIIKQRLKLIHCVVKRNLKSIKMIKVAWAIAENVLDQYTLNRPIVSRKRSVYDENVETAFFCICDSFRAINTFFSNFICFHVLLTILTTVIGVYISVESKTSHYVFFNFALATIYLCPLFLWMSTLSDFSVTQHLLNSCNWTNSIKPKQDNSNVKRAIYYSTYWRLYFDCGYFYVDMNLLDLILSLVTLLIFTVIP